MSKFIKLTVSININKPVGIDCTYESKQFIHQYINFSLVWRFCRVDDLTYLHIQNGIVVEVKETEEQIMEMINEKS